MSKVIISGNLLWPDGEIKPGHISVEGSKISAVSEQESFTPGSERTLDDTSHIQLPDTHVIAPGYIDLHINGAFGHDFTSNPRQISAVARNLPRFGVTAFLPTFQSAPLANYTRAVETFHEIRHEREMAAVLGLHLVGPYLNRTKVGSHLVAYLRHPDLDEILYFEPDAVRFLTLSPELPNALAFIRALRQRGIGVGLGHSTATYDEAQAAVEAGACWGSHLFNAMGGMHHRFPGLAGALLTDNRLRLGLIADNVHIHPAILKMVIAAKKPSHITLVSNAISAAGMPLGKYPLGSQTVESSSVGVRLPNGTLAGSLCMLDESVRNIVKLADRPLAEALQMASQTPADLLGLTDKGRLAPNYDADLIVLDDKLQVTLTMVRGQIVYEHAT